MLYILSTIFFLNNIEVVEFKEVHSVLWDLN